MGMASTYGDANSYSERDTLSSQEISKLLAVQIDLLVASLHQAQAAARSIFSSCFSASVFGSETLHYYNRSQKASQSTSCKSLLWPVEVKQRW